MFYLQNICQPFVIISSLSLAILVKSKCHPRIKEKIFPKKVVQESLCIDGQLHLIVTLFKQVYTKMLRLMKRVSNVMEINFIILKYIRKWAGK